MANPANLPQKEKKKKNVLKKQNSEEERRNFGRQVIPALADRFETHFCIEAARLRD